MAKEYSPYPKFKGSRWDVGDIFDEYHKNSVCPDLDWLEQKQLCKQYGIYNSQLTSPAPNTSTSLFMMASAGFMPHYAEYFYEDNKDGKTPVSSMYGKDNPIFYANSVGYFKQHELTKAVGAGQKFVDTGISAEYVLDRNIHEVTAKDVSMLVKEAWKNGTKAVYYLRTIKVGEQLVKTDELCSSCSG
jgi:ribonucleoside-diphosphate reductase alpha chain